MLRITNAKLGLSGDEESHDYRATLCSSSMYSIAA